ncbi:hypothetical protein WBG78_01410 [Chryseolinea sp. T2]|uniref:hypothetical protein n=1 Tax=Chryseolinea sp. T2 TaxID=3129255 RepID=UPI0030777364
MNNRRLRSFALVLLALSVSFFSDAQVQSRKLPGIINHPSFSLYAPFISFDGNALLFISNDGEDGSLIVSYTSRETDWVQPVPLPKHLSHRLIYLPGFALNAGGKKMYFSAAKAPVIGGYDIMYSELKGSTWGEAQNFLMPINSKSNEGCPSFTTDESAIYFMRCDKMDQKSASGCKLFSSKKKGNGQWEEPIELPASINTGNSQTPRIMADNETLIFSSDKMPGNKGGMDLYVSKLVNGTWSAPVALDFTNTSRDDQFVSVAALGRYLLRDVPGSRNNNELVEFLLPASIKPKSVMKVEGFVKDPSNGIVPSYISVVDRTSNKRIYRGRPAADGSYLFYIPEGSVYEFDVDPEQSNWTFFSKAFDLTTSDKIAQRERVNITLRQPVADDEIPLDMVSLRAGTGGTLDVAASDELKRLVRVSKANAQLSFEIQVSMTGYAEDSVRTNPDLTEVRMDTIKLQSVTGDSTVAPQDSLKFRTVYHNDRTPAIAQQIMTFITSQGGDAQRFTYKTAALPASTPGEKKFLVKAVAKRP